MANRLNQMRSMRQAVKPPAMRFCRPGNSPVLVKQKHCGVFGVMAPERLPVRKSYRRAAANKGDGWNMRKVFRQAVQRDGEVIELPKLKRKLRQRRIVLLIDVSGSMKDQTDSYLRFAHALAQAGRRIEIFTLGTRLTRITRAMKVRNRAQALNLVSGIVADWDGGTRLGRCACRPFLMFRGLPVLPVVLQC